MQEHGVGLHEDADVVAVRQGFLHLAGGEEAAFDECLWSTQASAPEWLSQTGLQLGGQSASLTSGDQLSCHHVTLHRHIVWNITSSACITVPQTQFWTRRCLNSLKQQELLASEAS